jgi:3-hydroxyisobutyrate dehydrogenase
VVERARPVLDALGSSVLEVGSGVEGSALKLAVNAWMASATVAMSDVLGLCDALGIAHDTLARALEAGALAMPYALQKMRLMDSGEFDPGFAVQLALKDVDLARESAPLGPLLAVVRQRLEQAVEAGHGDQDLAAVDTVRVRP